MNYLLLILFTSLINIICFYIGAKVGQKVDKKEDIKLPSVVKAIDNYKEHKEEKKRKSELETMLDNINNYDGTGLGQKEV